MNDLRVLCSTLLAALVPIILVFGGIAILADKAQAAPAAPSIQVDQVFPRGLPYAPTEDSCFTKRCVWDGKHQGDGRGRSYILTEHGGDFLVKHITHKRAHRLHAAYCERENVTCGYRDYA